jgi:hypothetical protein
VPFSADELQSFGEQWTVIRRFCSGSHRQWMTPGGTLVDETPPESFYNLPAVLACSLLDEVLSSLAGQGAFSVAPRAMLGAKMEASKAAIPWIDFEAVKAAKDQRNNLAHKGKLIPSAECLRIVEAIAAELRAWGAIPR